MSVAKYVLVWRSWDSESLKSWCLWRGFRSQCSLLRQCWGEREVNGSHTKLGICAFFYGVNGFCGRREVWKTGLKQMYLCVERWIARRLVRLVAEQRCAWGLRCPTEKVNKLEKGCSSGLHLPLQFSVMFISLHSSKSFRDVIIMPFAKSDNKHIFIQYYLVSLFWVAV